MNLKDLLKAFGIGFAYATGACIAIDIYYQYRGRRLLDNIGKDTETKENEG